MFDETLRLVYYPWAWQARVAKSQLGHYSLSKSMLVLFEECSENTCPDGRTMARPFTLEYDNKRTGVHAWTNSDYLSVQEFLDCIFNELRSQPDQRDYVIFGEQFTREERYTALKDLYCKIPYVIDNVSEPMVHDSLLGKNVSLSDYRPVTRVTADSYDSFTTDKNEPKLLLVVSRTDVAEDEVNKMLTLLKGRVNKTQIGLYLEEFYAASHFVKENSKLTEWKTASLFLIQGDRMKAAVVTSENILLELEKLQARMPSNKELLL